MSSVSPLPLLLILAYYLVQPYFLDFCKPSQKEVLVFGLKNISSLSFSQSGLDYDDSSGAFVCVCMCSHVHMGECVCVCVCLKESERKREV